MAITTRRTRYVLAGTWPSEHAEKITVNGWAVVNAPRPLLGSVTWEGPFICGIFYAAGPYDQLAERWRADDATLLVPVTPAQVIDKLEEKAAASGYDFAEIANEYPAQIRLWAEDSGLPWNPKWLADGSEEDVERRICPSCGTNSRIITRGGSSGTIVSACCEAVIPELNEEATVLIEDGKLICPYGDCGAADDIVELDVASRENELSLSEDGTITAHLGDHSFENDGFECRQCTRQVSLPDGSNITHC